LHIAVAVVTDRADRVLLARRPATAHQGGLWEFPGGKVEAGEDVLAALRREIEEEIGIRIDSARPFITIGHAYPDREVLLDVWRVERWRGIASGCEGQPIAWVRPDAFDDYDFPAADLPILSAIRLPSLYLITPEVGEDRRAFLHTLTICLDAGVRLVQLRTKQLSAASQFKTLTEEVLRLSAQFDARLILNASPAAAAALGAHGVHLTSSRLLQLLERPMGKDFWIGASCHNATEVEQATRIAADFMLISPVNQTASHPDAQALGWEGFQALARRAQRPVFALGGMQPVDMRQAWRCGAQGIAVISSVWHADDPAGAVRACLNTR
jgi:8-oxo-dGTP diphosphatase